VEKRQKKGLPSSLEEEKKVLGHGKPPNKGESQKLDRTKSRTMGGTSEIVRGGGLGKWKKVAGKK